MTPLAINGIIYKNQWKYKDYKQQTKQQLKGKHILDLKSQYTQRNTTFCLNFSW